VSGPSINTAIAMALIVYGAVLVLIAWVSVRRVRSPRDFFVAGRRVGLWVVALSTMSTAFSGFVFLGGPGLTYRIGLASMWISLPLGFTAGLLCWVSGRQLRRLAGRHEIFTIPDAIAVRFDHPPATRLAALAVAAGSIAYLGLQIRALGILGTGLLGLDSPLPVMLIGLAIIVAYSVGGGMVAGVYTDLFQGLWMLTVALLLGLLAIRAPGGVVRIGETLAVAAEFGESFVDPRLGGRAMLMLGFFMVFGVGVLGQPQMLHKFFMVRDEVQLRFMPVILGGSQAICLLIWFGIGLAVPALVAQGAMTAPSPVDHASPEFLRQQTPTLLGGLAVAGILAAIMSTADTFLHLAATALVRDLPRSFRRPVSNEMRAVRWLLPVVGLVAAAFAIWFGDLIAILGAFAFGTFAAALMPVMAIGFHWRRVEGRAVSASIATGLSVHLGLELLNRQTVFPGWVPPLAPGVMPAAIAMAASMLVLIVVTGVRTPRAASGLVSSRS